MAKATSNEMCALHQVCLALLMGKEQPAKYCRILHCQDGDIIPRAVVPGADLGLMQETDVKFLNTWILDKCAVVEYEEISTAGYLMALKPAAGWTVISLVFENLSGDLSKITPTDMAEPISACWDRYCVANRFCDTTAMADVFHSSSRLMFVDDKSNIQEFSSQEFCTLVKDRYQQPPHDKYAAYKSNHQITSERDTLQGCSMISPNLALVRLKVGHPPCLWSDLLVCAKLTDDKWWIVAKSSDHGEFIPSK